MLLPDGQSLLSRAYERAAALASAGELLTVTNRDYYFLSRDEFAKRKNGSLTARFVLEPQGRNTAPAVAIAALCVAQAHGEDATILVLPADHLIQKPAAFEQAAARAVEMAARGDL